jgi:hypothetical protein
MTGLSRYGKNIKKGYQLMIKFKVFTFTVLVFVLLSFVAIFLQGCSNINLADATLGTPVICQAVDSKTLAPLDKISIFTSDFKELHLNVLVSNAPEKTLVKVRFLGPDKSIIAESTQQIKGTEYVDFRMVRAKDVWKEGDYSAVLFLNGNEKATLKFQIQGEMISGTPQFTEATTCSAVDMKTGKPLDTTASFPTNFTTIFLSVKVNSAQPDTMITAAWFGPDDQQISQNSILFKGTGYVSFALDRTGDPWAAGTYEAVLFMGGKGDVVVPFIIK